MPTITDDDPYPPPARSIALELIDPLHLLSTSEHDQLNEWAGAVFSQLDFAGSIRVKIVNDPMMANAHERFSGISGTTDVLTFDLNHEHPIEHKILDTDLIVCYDEAERQAEQRSHSTLHELLLYIVHGTLHCLGYDDHDDTEYARMHAREDELLILAGIGPLFDLGES
ncbi:MAG: rRNA maturation RNase YbeY [Phycisphaerales bacterium]|nr:rRNA maturation RNase YbeY [Phycisphaerales bacterium]